MTGPRAAISFNLDRHLIQAAYPLLDAGEVEAIEWSFDTLYQHANIPDWFPELLQDFGEEGRLIGHGVFFSIFRAMWSEEQENWLADLKKKVAHFQFDHISEHFGFLTGAHFHQGAPLSVPYTSGMLAIGQDRLLRLAHAAQCPVGLENLAFSWSPATVQEHGQFLEALLAPVNGFIILDLHNLYCQLHNFELQFADLIRLYPLDRVREIHISGGSWDDADTERRVRRDTHDDGVPEEVFDLLTQALPLCPNLQFVVLEQMGTSLHSLASQERFRKDFRQMAHILRSQPTPSAPSNNFLPDRLPPPGPPLESPALYAQQLALSHILENAADAAAATQALDASPLAGTAWHHPAWPPHMLETAVRIARKWKQGFHNA